MMPEVALEAKVLLRRKVWKIFKGSDCKVDRGREGNLKQKKDL